MIQKFIVTGRNSESLLLSKLFSSFENIKIKAGTGYSSALSLARTILSYHKKPVLLLLDAESRDQTDIAEEYSFVNGYLWMSTPGAVFKIILFQPELETVFFEDAKVAEHLIGRHLTEPELESARLRPKQFLQRELQSASNKTHILNTVISKLDESDLEKLRQLPEFQEIQSFLQAEKDSLSA